MTNSNFCTPPELLDIVRQLDTRGIVLDPCSNANSRVDAHIEWDGGDYDGLSMSWRGHGLVFMNPPHSMSPNNIEPWMEKAYREFVHPDFKRLRPHRADSQFTDQFVGLIPAKTDTAWFHDHAVTFAVKCFLRGRPKFWLNGEPMPGPGKFASMLIYAGHKPDLFKKLFNPLGWIAS